MVTTDLAKEFKLLLKEICITRKEICLEHNIEPANLSRMVHKKLPTPQFVRILDSLGYNIEIEFVPKELR